MIKKFLFVSITLLISLLFTAGVRATDDQITVYKSPTCGCCTKWAKHLQANGFSVTTHDVDNVNTYKKKYGVPTGAGSCHTAIIGDYFVEGHVPAQDIKRLLTESPEARGLAVPGMPMGSPGMEGPRKDDYSTYLVDKEGKTSVFANH